MFYVDKFKSAAMRVTAIFHCRDTLHRDVIERLLHLSPICLNGIQYGSGLRFSNSSYYILQYSETTHLSTRVTSAATIQGYGR